MADVVSKTQHYTVQNGYRYQHDKDIQRCITHKTAGTPICHEKFNYFADETEVDYLTCFGDILHFDKY
jgi:hypothetical protein